MISIWRFWTSFFLSIINVHTLLSWNCKLRLCCSSSQILLGWSRSTPSSWCFSLSIIISIFNFLRGSILISIIISWSIVGIIRIGSCLRSTNYSWRWFWAVETNCWLISCSLVFIPKWLLDMLKMIIRSTFQEQFICLSDFYSYLLWIRPYIIQSFRV